MFWTKLIKMIPNREHVSNIRERTSKYKSNEITIYPQIGTFIEFLIKLLPNNALYIFSFFTVYWEVECLYEIKFVY